MAHRSSFIIREVFGSCCGRKTGIFFDEFTTEALGKAIYQAEHIAWDSEALYRHARDFQKNGFKGNIFSGHAKIMREYSYSWEVIALFAVVPFSTALCVAVCAGVTVAAQLFGSIFTNVWISAAVSQSLVSNFSHSKIVVESQSWLRLNF